MARLKAITAFVAVTTALGIAACGSDKPQKNPSFATGEADSPASGAATSSAGAGDAGGSTGGLGTSGAPEQALAGNGGAAGSASPEVGGAAGAGPELPPYDCVLHPITHLEIINACTDAVRIEKHPELPALPQ